MSEQNVIGDNREVSGKIGKLVVGNWKMHGGLVANEALLKSIAAAAPAISAGIGICVPFPYLAQAQMMLTGTPVLWGVQDISRHASDKGAFTGDVSALMATDFGSKLTLVGHSERRSLHHESDAVVVRKAQLAIEFGLMPVVCVGETLEDREAGHTEKVVGTQLDAVLNALDVTAAQKIVVAYEPVWAIGTGKSASAAQAQEVHAFLRGRLKAKSAALAGVKLLYGGSVKPANAAELFGQQDIDGGLIGGAALVADDFLAICRAAT